MSTRTTTREVAKALMAGYQMMVDCPLEHLEYLHEVFGELAVELQIEAEKVSPKGIGMKWARYAEVLSQLSQDLEEYECSLDEAQRSMS